MLLEKNALEEIKLSDVIDLDFLQEFQDTFAKAMGVASITLDHQGPVTAPSNFSDFCEKCVRTTEEGFKRCNECDLSAGKASFEQGKPLIYRCHAGLIDFSAPIIVDGKLIGAMLGGQVLSKSPDVGDFQQIMDVVGPDVAQKIPEALSNVRILSEDRIEAVAKLMYLVANSLSQIGYKNLKISRNAQKVNLLLNSLPDGIVLIDSSGVIRFCNTTLEKMFAYEKSEIIGQKLDFIIEKSHSDSGFDSIDDFSCPACETKGIRKDGTQLWVEINMSEMCYDDDCSKIVSIRDVNSRKILEQTVNNAQTQFLAILENLPFMAWLKDTDGRFIAVNKEFSQNCKTPIDEILGKTDLDFFPGKMAENYMRDDQYIIRTKKHKAIEEQITTPDGVKWFETFKVPIIGTDGEVIGTTGYSLDITERRCFDKSKHEFMSIISHELRSQLNAIRGALVVISGSLNNTICTHAKELIELANINNARLINLVNDIIDIEKIETRSADYNLKIYDLRLIIQKTLDDNKFGTKFEFDNFEIASNIKADKSRIVQVLTNILTKAIDCSLEKSPIRLALSEKDGYINLKIISLGHNIPAIHKESLFSKVSDITMLETDNTQKTGLEMSLCKAIIESFDGSINFEVTEDGKNIFSIELPKFN
ncbi:MAG: PocR ligand-binding domain-containing protein [Candidatus Gastranaerophilales bacterium]|nr:PocR ligand-binding domain-containing protein [Candidatus Gastranaerophilales bacterium]